jgi:S-adenosylmethionine decarboxylase
MDIYGRHLLVELYDCDPGLLADPEGVERSMLAAAESARATILGHHFHRFEPQGVSGVVVIAESHVTIHTWPEHGYAAVDIFTCGRHMRPDDGIRVLERAFGCRDAQITEVRRGLRKDLLSPTPE